MAGIPPWLNVSPMDFVNAASTGAHLGLQRAGLAQQGQEAAQRQSLAAASLMAQQNESAQRIAAERDNAAKALAAHMAQQQGLDKYREDQLNLGQGRLDLAASSAQAKQREYADRLAKAGNLSPEQKIKYTGLMDEHRRLLSHLYTKGLSDEQVNDILSRMSVIDAQISDIDKGGTTVAPASALNPTDTFPAGSVGEWLQSIKGGGNAMGAGGSLIDPTAGAGLLGEPAPSEVPATNSLTAPSGNQYIITPAE